MTRKTCWPFERGRTHFLTRSLRQLFARLLCSCFVGCFVRCFVTPQNYLTASCGARSFELAATPKFDQNSHKISTKLENFFATSRQLFAGATTFWRPIRESSGSTSCCLVRLGSGATLCREICRTAPAQNEFWKFWEQCNFFLGKSFRNSSPPQCWLREKTKGYSRARHVPNRPGPSQCCCAVTHAGPPLAQFRFFQI